MPKLRAILDTDVIIAGLRSPTGASYALLELVLSGDLEFILSVPLILEYEAVCMRPENLIAAQLSEPQMQAFLDALSSRAIYGYTDFSWRPQLHDANDELVLEAAINGGASHLISFNHRDFVNVPANFGINLVTPRDFLILYRETLS